MTQQMGLTDFSASDDEDDERVVLGYVELLPPFDTTVGWRTKEFKDGGATIGREDGQDITIAHASVSSLHAAIDAIDLPDVGKKRLTLKDLRSTNGTYIVDATTGERKRLAPRKATMLPEEGGEIHFGSVACKFAMGQAPDALDEEANAAKAYEAETQFPGEYDVDTQVPGGDEPLAAIEEEHEVAPEAKARSSSPAADRTGTLETPATAQKSPATSVDAIHEGSVAPKAANTDAPAAVLERHGHEGNVADDVNATDTDRLNGEKALETVQHRPEEADDKKVDTATAGESTETTRCRDGQENTRRPVGDNTSESEGDDDAQQKSHSVLARSPEHQQPVDSRLDNGGSASSGGGGLESIDAWRKNHAAGRVGPGDDDGHQHSRQRATAFQEGSDVQQGSNKADREYVGSASPGRERAEPGASAGARERAVSEIRSTVRNPHLLANADEEDSLDVPTQAMAMEIDEDMDGSGRATASTAELCVTSEVTSSRVPNKVGSDAADLPNAHSDGGDDTADEGETARLFEEDDGDLDKHIADTSTDPSPPGSMSSHHLNVQGPSVTPNTPPRASQLSAEKGQAGSPGSASDASTQRQETQAPPLSPPEPQEAGAGADDGSGRAPVGANGTEAIGRSQYGAAGDAGLVEMAERQGRGDSDGEDTASDSSGALIPAHEAGEYDDEGNDTLAGDGSDTAGATLRETSPEEDAAAAAAPDVGAAVDRASGAGEDARVDSGSETDATEIDTDDGVREDAGGDDAKAREQVDGAASPPCMKPSEALVRDEATGKRNASAGEVRSPGGSLLRRMSTEDAMQAIAREQQRAEASRSSAASALGWARDMNAEDGAEDGASRRDAEPVDSDAEMDTQVVAMDEDFEGDESEAGAIGTEILEEWDSEGVDLATSEALPPVVEDVAQLSEKDRDHVHSGEGAISEAPSARRSGHREESSEAADAQPKLALAGAEGKTKSYPCQGPDTRDTEHAYGPTELQGARVADGRGEAEIGEGAAVLDGQENQRGVETGTTFVPRSSGRRRVKPKAFDDSDEEGESSQPTAMAKASQNGALGEGTASDGDEGERGGATEKLEARLSTRKAPGYGKPTPIDGDGARFPARDGIEKPHQALATSASEASDAQTREPSPPASATRGKRRRSERDLGTPERSATSESKRSAPGATPKRGRRSALEAAASKATGEPTAVAAGTGRGRSTRSSQNTRARSSSADTPPAGGAKRTGKDKAARKRRRACDVKEDVSDHSESEAEQPASARRKTSQRQSAGGPARDSLSGMGKAAATAMTPVGQIATGNRRGRKKTARAVGATGADEESHSSPGVNVGPDHPGDVCFTGVQPQARERACIKKLGISEVEDVLEATHLVAGGSGVPLKRTPKLLAGIGCCRYVVDVEWLYQSSKEGKLLDGLEYVLSDPEAEKKWDFNLRASIVQRPIGGILAGLHVFVDPSVAGTQGMSCPPLDQMKMVVTSAGGSWLSQLPKRGGPDPQSLLVISHPDVIAATGSKASKSRTVVAAGRNGTAYLPEMLFLSILRQKVAWPADLAVGIAGQEPETPVRRKPTKRRRSCL